MPTTIVAADPPAAYGDTGPRYGSIGSPGNIAVSLDHHTYLLHASTYAADGLPH